MLAVLRQSVIRQSVRFTSSAATSGALTSTFKSFAEYRSFITKKDPQTLKLRHEILFKGQQKHLPDSQAELEHFKQQAKKVAYN